jgi:hypothetical protein
MSDLTLVQKPRADNPGRVHIWAQGQTWCGRKMRGLSRSWEGDATDATCQECRTAKYLNRPKPYRRNR